MKIELWSEGYAATGESSGASYHGTFEAESLKDAVIQFRKTLSKHSASTIDLNRLTFWGCRFFSNEKNAREIFG